MGSSDMDTLDSAEAGTILFIFLNSVFDCSRLTG